jgi:quinol monooxygenase YgiN
MYVVIWRFRVRPHQVASFERAYGPSGIWAQFFAKARGFLGIELVKDIAVPGLYLTIDRWRAHADYDNMLRERIDEYTHIDQSCAEYTLTEEKLGAYETVEVGFGLTGAA